MLFYKRTLAPRGLGRTVLWAATGVVLVVAGCGVSRQEAPLQRTGPTMSLNEVAEGYVKLVLAVGQHDRDYVDAFYGPEEWRDAAAAEPLELGVIRDRANELIAAAESAPVDAADELVVLRRGYVATQLRALAARVDMLRGTELSFDEESKAFYDAVAPTHPDAHFQTLLDELDPLLPGMGDLIDRYTAYRNRFVIPRNRLDAVFSAAIDACRERTQRHLELPEGESFAVEYVTDKSWGAYNWYQGAYRSVIQVNTDLPIYIDRAVDLACHEGYPGHHVYNALLEQHLVRERGWVEFSIYPLFSPQSLIAEGTANYGVRIAFPGEERIAFERDTLFPLAGLDPSQAAPYYQVLEKVERLGYAGNEAARRYIDGDIDAEAAEAWLARYALMEPRRARQRMRFVEQYRSYVINYNLGEDLVRKYLERRSGGGEDPERMWEEFGRLLSSPRLPSGL
jgi:hypothetical protein